MLKDLILVSVLNEVIWLKQITRIEELLHLIWHLLAHFLSTILLSRTSLLLVDESDAARLLKEVLVVLSLILLNHISDGLKQARTNRKNLVDELTVFFNNNSEQSLRLRPHGLTPITTLPLQQICLGEILACDTPDNLILVNILLRLQPSKELVEHAVAITNDLCLLNLTIIILVWNEVDMTHGHLIVRIITTNPDINLSIILPLKVVPATTSLVLLCLFLCRLQTHHRLLWIVSTRDLHMLEIIDYPQLKLLQVELFSVPCSTSAASCYTSRFSSRR